MYLQGSLFILGCAVMSACAKTEAQAENPLAIANAFVEREFPEVNIAAMRAEVTANETTWTVTYRPRRDSVGGGPEVTIEKPSGRVVAAQSFQ
jgi:hypothetical protein